MGLSIKNQRVHDLVKETARRTGRTQTGAIELALEELLARTEREQSQEAREQRAAELIAAIQMAVAAGDSDMRIEDLYDDETGMPA